MQCMILPVRAFLVAGLIWASATSTSSARVTSICIHGNVVILALYGHEFAVDLKYRPLITTENREVLRVAASNNGRCRNGRFVDNSNPIGVLQFSIRSPHRESFQRGEFPLQSVIKITGSLDSKSSDLAAIKRFRDRTDRPGGTIDHLPQVAGFHAFARSAESGRNWGPFMSIPGGMASGNGDPVIFECGDTISPPDQLPPSSPYPACSVKYGLAAKYSIRYQFSSFRFPIQNWAELDGAVRKFVNGMMILPDR